MQKVLEDANDEYNLSHTAQMNLVFFQAPVAGNFAKRSHVQPLKGATCKAVQDCVEHINRIARVLAQPRGVGSWGIWMLDLRAQLSSST